MSKNTCLHEKIKKAGLAEIKKFLTRMFKHVEDGSMVGIAGVFFKDDPMDKEGCLASHFCISNGEINSDSIVDALEKMLKQFKKAAENNDIYSEIGNEQF